MLNFSKTEKNSVISELSDIIKGTSEFGELADKEKMQGAVFKRRGMKRKFFGVVLFLILGGMVGCMTEQKQILTDNAGAYRMISMSEAEEIFAESGDYIILDVREKDEFDSGHIPGAICIPHEQIAELAPDMIPDKKTVIYVYCRSGRRSKIAAQTLADVGYVNVTENGGILDYTGELEMD